MRGKRFKPAGAPRAVAIHAPGAGQRGLGLWDITTSLTEDSTLAERFALTRLETRTKESKTSASVVVEKPTREMKVNGANFGAAPTDHDPLVKGLSKSVILRTRKMVNYA